MARQIKAMVMGLIFTVVAVGFAYAIPKTLQLAADIGSDAEAELVEGRTGGHPSSKDVRGRDGAGSRANQKNERSTELRRARRDNHGAAVSSAAHCDLKGKALGELVRTIAKDRNATVAAAERACELARKAAAGGRASSDAAAGASVEAGNGSEGRAGGSSAASGSGHRPRSDKAKVPEDAAPSEPARAPQPSAGGDPGSSSKDTERPEPSGGGRSTDGKGKT